VAPALHGDGIAKLDAVVLSHEDSDHIGGALTVLETFEVASMVSSLPARHALHGLAPHSRRCGAGDTWEWDGVRFEFLHPAGGEGVRRNNLSCVLRIVAGGRAMLLTGDIERVAEAELIARRLPKSDVLVVPHHGSRTSSSADFIAAVAPSLAIVPVGYRSRFGHPSAEVLERYRSHGTRVVRTDLEGAVTLRMGGALALQTERQRRGRYWLE
jgi:competence protein ComEC